MLTFRIYQDASRQYRWTLYAENNFKIGDSGEGYVHKAHAQAMVNKIIAEASSARVDDQTNR